MVLTTQEYDQFKESKLSEIENNFIDDKSYLHQHRKYFQTYKDVIVKGFLYQGQILLLPPYSIEKVNDFEKLNKIYLPIELKYYLTNISREVWRSGGRYTINLYEPLDDDIDLNYDDFLGGIYTNFISKIEDPNLKVVIDAIELSEDHPFRKRIDSKFLIDDKFLIHAIYYRLLYEDYMEKIESSSLLYDNKLQKDISF